jgi:hypothetical protein
VQVQSCTGGKCPGAEEFYKKIQVAITEARINLEAAQQRQKAYANTKRREVKFSKGNLVMLSTANLHIKKGSTRKLLPRLMGPFSVIEEINKVAMILDSPNKLRMHDVFHISFFETIYRREVPKVSSNSSCNGWGT